MKKSFSKKLMILAFAFGGLIMIGNNVYAEEEVIGEIGDEKIKHCMAPGGNVTAISYRCDDPGYHSLPKWECGTIYVHTGKGFEQCF